MCGEGGDWWVNTVMNDDEMAWDGGVWVWLDEEDEWLSGGGVFCVSMWFLLFKIKMIVW
jgi:hypothetical protein